MAQTVKRTSTFIYIQSTEVSTGVLYFINNGVLEEVTTYNFNSSAYQIYTLTKEGTYRLIITEGGVDTTYNIPIYTNTINSLANEMCDFICKTNYEYLEDCNPCNDVEFASKRSLRYNNLVSKLTYLETQLLTSYSDSDRLNYSNFLQNVFTLLACNPNTLIENIIKEECLQGISNNIELYEKQLISKYLGIYFLENSNTLNFNNTPLFTNAGDSSAPSYKEIPDLYLITDIKTCLCKTGFKFEDSETLYNDGITITTPTINLPPISQDIFVNIESNTTLYEININPSWFNAVYSDDNTTNPVNIILNNSPLGIVKIRDAGDVDITDGVSIPFTNIGNYKIYATVVGIPSKILHLLPYRVTDGNSESSIYNIQVTLNQIINQPPIITNGFDINLESDGTRLLSLNDLYSLGAVADPEGDSITMIKLVSNIGMSVGLQPSGGGASTVVNVGDEIDITSYTVNEALLKINFDLPIVSRTLGFSLAFKDSGSNIYSDTNNPQNIMNINLNPTYNNNLNVVFSSRLEISTVQRLGWFPLGRIRYDGNINDLEISFISEAVNGGAYDMMLSRASSDQIYDIYDNANNIVVANTTNPPDNTYDVFVFGSINSNLKFNYSIRDINSINNLNITTDVAFNTISVPTGVTAYKYQIENKTSPQVISELGANPSLYATFIENYVTVAEQIDLAQLNAGSPYTFTILGLIGVAFRTTTPTGFKVFDSLNNEITTESFDILFNASNGIEVYLSKQQFAPSEIYFKVV